MINDHIICIEESNSCQKYYKIIYRHTCFWIDLVSLVHNFILYNCEEYGNILIHLFLLTIYYTK